MCKEAQQDNPFMSMFGKFMKSPMKMAMEGSPVMEMCKQMTQAVRETNENAAYATPELRELFDDWLGQVENEVLAFLSKKDNASVAELSKELGITEQSAIFPLSKLTRQGKLDLRRGLRTNKQTADL